MKKTSEFAIAGHEEKVDRLAHLKNMIIDLFQEEKKLTLKEGAMDLFLVEAAKKGIDITKFFDIEETIAPRKEYLEKRAQLRPILDAEKNKKLDEIMAKVLVGTSIRYR